MAVKIIIECRECDRDIDNGEDVLCCDCYDALLEAKDIMEDNLQKKIDELEEELSEIKNRFEL